MKLAEQLLSVLNEAAPKLITFKALKAIKDDWSKAKTTLARQGNMKATVKRTSEFFSNLLALEDKAQKEMDSIAKRIDGDVNKIMHQLNYSHKTEDASSESSLASKVNKSKLSDKEDILSQVDEIAEYARLLAFIDEVNTFKHLVPSSLRGKFKNKGN